MDNRLKYDREMKIGVPTSKTLKKLRREQQKRATMNMCSFYCTATRYMTRHLLLYDLDVLHPLIYVVRQRGVNTYAVELLPFA